MARLTYDDAVKIAGGDNDYVERALRLSKAQQWGFVMSALGYIRIDGKMVNIKAHCRCYQPWIDGCASHCPVCRDNDEWTKENSNCGWAEVAQ